MMKTRLTDNSVEGCIIVKNVKIYPNESVRKVIAFIPKGHHHIRLAIYLQDQVIVLHEATIAAIVRAYIDIVTHPKRRAVELVLHNVGNNKKHGYAKWQLIESRRNEEEIVAEGEKILAEGSTVLPKLEV